MNDLDQFIDEHPSEFVAKPYYDRRGDFVAYFASAEPHVAHHVDHRITVYYARHDGRTPVGIKIKSVGLVIEYFKVRGMELAAGAPLRTIVTAMLGDILLASQRPRSRSHLREYRDAVRAAGDAVMPEAALREAG